MKKIIKNHLGFTLIEIMVSTGIVAMIGLIAYSSLNTSNVTMSRSLVNAESSYIKNLVIANMSNPKACENTFQGQPVARSGISLINKNNVVFLSPGQVIYEGGANQANKKILFTVNTIDSSALTGVAASDKTLRLKIVYTLQNSLNKATKMLQRSFDVDVYIVKSGSNVGTCFVDTAGMIKKAVEYSCQSNPTAPGPSNFVAVWDASTNTCTHQVTVTSATVVGSLQTCPAGQFMYESVAVGGVTTFACKAYTLSGACPAGSFIKEVRKDGSMDCVKFVDLFPTTGSILSATSTGYQQLDLDCGVDQVLRKYGTPNTCAPKVIIKLCPTYQYISDVDANGNVTCSAYTKKTAGACAPGSYLQSINSDGSVPAGGCQPLTLPAVSCSAQYVLQSIDGAGNPGCVPSWI